LLQCLVRIRSPPLHVFEHTPHSDQRVQEPSTIEKKNIFSKSDFAYTIYFSNENIITIYFTIKYKVLLHYR
jgi:hypothetical protein